MRLFFMINSLDVNRGGKTKAVMLRARILTDHGYDVTILTTDHQGDFRDARDFRSIVDQLKTSGRIPAGVRVRNFFEDICGFGDEIGENGWKHPLGPRARAHGPEGRISTDELGRVRRIDTLKGGAVLCRQFFNPWGAPAMALWEGADPKPAMVGGRPYVGLVEPVNRWVSSLLSPGDILVCDSRASAPYVADVNVPGVAKALVLHGSHLVYPSNDHNKVKPGFKEIFEGKTFDKVILLTGEQVNDIERAGIGTGRLAVLANNIAELSAEDVPKKPNYVAVLARYEKVKNLDHCIDIARLVGEAVPDFTMDFFGRGTEKDNLIEYSNQTGAARHVRINDYTPTPLEAMASSVCSLLTSNSEGFPLTIVENFSVGTPMIAYDVKYGPASIIEDGRNGYLVKKDDTRKAADHLISILKDAQLGASLSAGARATAQKFSRQEFVRQWSGLFDEIRKPAC